MTVDKDLRFVDAFNGKDFQFFWFSQLLNRAVCAAGYKNPLGKLSDLVFKSTEPYPEAAGIYIEHGWGKPTEFVPWNRVVGITKDAVMVQPPEDGMAYPPFVDQQGWILIHEHLIGRTVLDTDGRRVEVVNDVHLLESKGRLIIVHVDVSFNGFLRKWGFGRLRWLTDRLISWRYVQPFSLEDSAKTDAVSLSITQEQAKELPSEDLADVLEMLSGDEQEAFFSTLDAEKAAETLLHAEPRVKRQIVEDLPTERAQAILSELSIPQLADLFSVLPHDDKTELMQLLSEDKARRIDRILSEPEVTARQLASVDYIAFTEEERVGKVLETIRKTVRDHETISYIYVIAEGGLLIGVVDLRKLVLSDDDTPLSDIMSTSVVSAEEGKTREELEDIFVKYRYRTIPVVDRQDSLLGVIRYNDLMQSLSDQKV